MKITAISFLIVFAFSFGQLQSQNAYCDDNRYLNEVFPSTTSTTVKYGENITYAGNLRNLRMDVYTPDGDVATERPVIIMAHGGSFILGDKATLQYYCEYFAKRGYVAATMDYRLYDGPLFPVPDSTVMLDVVIKAVGDMKAAVRYFRKDAATTNQFRVDTNFIFVGGQSAGGILAGHMAYINDLSEVQSTFIYNGLIANGGLPGTTDDPANPSMGYSSEIQGVINQFGALYNADWIQPGDAPLISIHGTNDDVVPYGYGMVSISGIPIISMEGSSVMHPKADQAGVLNRFISVPGGGHGDFLSNAVWQDSLDRSSVWLMESVACEGFTVPVEQIDVSQQVNIFPNPASEHIQIELSNIQSNYDIKVFDGLGRLVQAQDGISDNSQLDVTALNDGFYQIYVLFDNLELAPVTQKVFVSNQK